MEIAIYSRVSRDRSGEAESPQRQEKACRSFAAMREWEVTAEFRDNDVSAYSPKVSRPAFQALVEGVQAGRFDGVLVWKLDRLVRRPAEFERFWSACEKNGVFVVSVTEPIDTSNELGLAIVRILVTFASLESATKGERLRAYYADMRAQGKVHASGRGYGYTPHHEVIEHEATVIRDACARLLQGASMAHLARDLNAAGETTARGKPWSVSTLRKVVTHPRIVGRMTFRGEVIGPAPWTAIVDRATFDRVRLLLADPARHRADLVKGPTNLLTSFARCGRCGSPLRRRPHSRRNTVSYSCPYPPRGCNSVSIRYDILDTIVTEEVLTHLERVRRRAREFNRRERSGAPADRAGPSGEIAIKLEDAARDYYVDRTLNRTEYLAIRDALHTQLARRQRDIVPGRVAAALELLGRRSITRAWDEADLTVRRQVLDLVLDHVTIQPAPRATGRFHPERVSIHFVGQPDGITPSVTQFVSMPTRRDAPDTELQVREVARRLRLSEPAIWRVVRTGELTAHRQGRGWRVLQRDLDSFIEHRRIVPQHGLA